MGRYVNRLRYNVSNRTGRKGGESMKFKIVYCKTVEDGLRVNVRLEDGRLIAFTIEFSNILLSEDTVLDLIKERISWDIQLTKLAEKLINYEDEVD